MYIIDESGSLSKVQLGLDLKNGECPQVVIPANSIFGAMVHQSDSYSLVGCMVSPGFDFRDFELFKKEQLLTLFPQHEDIIRTLGLD